MQAPAPLIGGAALSVLATLTGLCHLRTISEAGTQARRTINTHGTIISPSPCSHWLTSSGVNELPHRSRDP